MTEPGRAAPRRLTTIDPQPAPRRRVLSRLKLGHVLAIVAGLLAVLLNVALLRSDDPLIRVATAGEPIRSGTAIDVATVELVEVPWEGSLTGRFLTAEELTRLDGTVATRTISAGEPLLDTDLRAVSGRDGLRAMSLPIDQSKAVSGALAVGDRVDVISVEGEAAAFIATAVEIVGVPSEDGASAFGTSGTWAPTLAVTDAQALRIAAALELGRVHVIRSTGSPEVEVESFSQPPEVDTDRGAAADD